MELPPINNGLIAFIAGVIASPHCVGMCGPLGCLLMKHKAKAKNNFLTYHFFRVLSYTILGGLAGAFSFQILKFFEMDTINFFPWVIVAFLLIFSFRLDKFFPKPKHGQLFFYKLTQSSKSGALLGACTPFLPCGALYMILGIGLLSGSGSLGAEIALGFGLGTIPLLLLAQTQLLKIQERFTLRLFSLVQRSLAFIGAMILILRILGAQSPLVANLCSL